MMCLPACVREACLMCQKGHKLRDVQPRSKLAVPMQAGKNALTQILWGALVRSERGHRLCSGSASTCGPSAK